MDAAQRVCVYKRSLVWGWFTTNVLNGFSVHLESPGPHETTWKQALTFVSAAVYIVPETQETP